MNFIKRTWARGAAGKIVVGLGGLTAACCACSAIALIIPTPRQQRAEATVVAAAATVERAASTAAPEIAIAVTILASPAPSAAPLPTNTPAPTDTPEPTPTPEPTFTPEPTPTLAPPVDTNGRGDDVVNITKDDRPKLLTFIHGGRGNFIVESYDEDGNSKDLLVNHIGRYRGTLLIDSLDDEPKTARLAIQADGEWNVSMAELGYARFVELPGVIEGTGSDVFFIAEGKVDLFNMNAGGESNFVVYVFAEDYRDLLVNEIAPYSGIKPVPASTYLVAVIADGPWRIEVTAR